MTLIICQKRASGLLTACCKISKTRDDDPRGWYIVANNPGTLYLHKDGIIRNGVIDSDIPADSAFWPTKKEATKFYQDWLEKYNNKMQSDADKRCPECGGSEKLDANYCPNCGRQLRR